MFSKRPEFTKERVRYNVICRQVTCGTIISFLFVKQMQDVSFATKIVDIVKRLYKYLVFVYYGKVYFSSVMTAD